MEEGSVIELGERAPEISWRLIYEMCRTFSLQRDRVKGVCLSFPFAVASDTLTDCEVV